MIEIHRRMLYIPVFHIDTNLINARGKLKTMNQIEGWAADGVILINMSGVSFNEALAGDNAKRSAKAIAQIFTLTDEEIDVTDALYQRIERALFQNGAQTQNQRNDVKIIYDAAHWNAILITRDGDSCSQPGGILGNRDKLRDFVPIMSDSEAVCFIQNKISERDDFNRRVAHDLGHDLPEWTGKD